MHTRFAFGKHGLDLSLPHGRHYEVVESRSAPPLIDPAKAIAYALDHPIASEPLLKLAQGKRTAAINICDITRPAPNRLTLPPMLERLHAAGIPVEGITILVATGLHRSATPEEIDIIVGPEIARKYRILNHDAKDLDGHRALGATKRGTPIYSDERFMAADLHLTLGFIEQHLMLGFSGGRKLVAPGVAGQETIKVIHSPKFMREPMATEGSIEGNPLHDELIEIAGIARHDFMLDVTMTPEREITGVFAGHPVQAHLAGVDFIRRTSVYPLPQRADAAITSAAGYPLDLTFYQTAKGITAAEHVVKPGGRILLLGECAEGVGSPEYAEKLREYPGHQPYLDSIAGTPVVTDQWQLEKVALVGLRNDLFFYTPGVAAEDIGALAERYFTDVNDAVSALLEDLPPNACIVLIPEGPYSFARVAT